MSRRPGLYRAPPSLRGKRASPSSVSAGGRSHEVFGSKELLQRVIRCLVDDVWAEEEGVYPQDDTVPNVSKQVTSALIPLMKASKAGMGACSAFLYEILDTVEPLISVLGATRTRSSYGVVSWALGGPISSQHWERFALCTSRTKTVVCRPAVDLTLDACWRGIISTATNGFSPTPWFPSIRRLYITSEDASTLSFAASLIPRAGIINVIPPSPSSLDATFLGAAGSLTKLGIYHPASSGTLAAISQLIQVQDLVLTVPRDIQPSLLLSTLAHLQHLGALAISEASSYSEEVELTSSTGVAFNVSHISPQSVMLPRLQGLTVTGRPSFQRMVEESLQTPSLIYLKITITRRRRPAGIVSLIEAYSSRNPHLTTLIVTMRAPGGSTRKQGFKDPESLQRYKLNNTALFIASLSRLVRLEELDIIHVPFVDSLIVKHIVHIAQSLPSLRQLVFLPAPVTSCPADEITPLTLSLLRTFVICRPRLARLAVPLSFTTVPLLEPAHLPCQQLETLYMFPTGTPPATYGEELAVAQFLNAAFCNLQEVNYLSRAEKGSKEDLAWGAICNLFLTVRQQAKEPVTALPEVAILTDPHESDSDDGPDDEDEEQIDQLDEEELFEAGEPVEVSKGTKQVRFSVP